MKQRLLVFIILTLVGLLLVFLNAVSYVKYVRKDEIPDGEHNPDRSTYNTGTTGTRAFYDLLGESGYKVKRWREPITKFRAYDENKLAVFVVIGRVPRKFSEDEKEHLLNWVSEGGTLVIIDREPPDELLVTTADWKISKEHASIMSGDKGKAMIKSVDPGNQNQMTAKTKAAKPQQPTVFTRSVNSVQSSKFASSIKISRLKDVISNENYSEGDGIGNSGKNYKSSSPFFEGNQEAKKGESGKVKASVKYVEDNWDKSLSAPIVHFANDEKALLVSSPFGEGEIVFLSDPYFVANGGIRLADNVQMAVNVVASKGGVIAFDEYHHGFGNDEDLLLAYLSGTPAVSIFLQLALIFSFIFFSQSRRFARALPLSEPNRLSKLEYVSAMAQLQRRTKTFDLAVENIYTGFRRRVSRSIGVNNQSASLREIASLIAERTKYSVEEIENLMRQCKDAGTGRLTKGKNIVELASRLRKIEAELGLKKRKNRI